MGRMDVWNERDSLGRLHRSVGLTCLAPLPPPIANYMEVVKRASGARFMLIMSGGAG